MIGKFKPYPAYKDSGVEWLGEVPDHWEVTKLSRVVYRTNAGEVINKGWWGEGEEVLYTCARSSLISDYTSFPLWKRTTGEDLLLTRNGTPYVHRPVTHAIYSNVVQRIKLRSGNNREWIARTLEAATRSMKGYGVSIESLNYDMWKVLTVLLPSIDERSAIIRFLNYIDFRIQRYIQAKKKLITLLEEYKQAIINQAVTKGLDPNVKMRPSGIEWLGEIPAHWELRPLKGLASIQSGLTLGKNYGSQSTTQYPYLRVANVQAGHLDLSEVAGIMVPKKEADARRLKTGDVLMTEGGDPDKLGRGCVWTGEISPCLHQNHIFAVRPDPEVLHPSFLALQLRSHHAKTYFLITSKQTTNLASTNKTTIGVYVVLLPALIEQNNIVNVVRKRIDSLDKLISSVSRGMDTVREYSTRLISDVVTGKVDVREIAAQLPEGQDKDDLEEDFFEQTQTIGYI